MPMVAILYAAAAGAVAGAVTNKDDPLEGALQGAVLGGVGAAAAPVLGIGGAGAAGAGAAGAGAAGAGAAGAGAAGASAGITAGEIAAQQAAQQAATQGITQGATSAAGEAAAQQAVQQAAQQAATQGVAQGAADAATMAGQSLGSAGLSGGQAAMVPPPAGMVPPPAAPVPTTPLPPAGMAPPPAATPAPADIISQSAQLQAQNAEQAAIQQGIQQNLQAGPYTAPSAPGPEAWRVSDAVTNMGDQGITQGSMFGDNALGRGAQMAMDFAKKYPNTTMLAGSTVLGYLTKPEQQGEPTWKGSKYKFDYGKFNPGGPTHGPFPSFAVGGPVEQMSAENAVGANMMYPQSQLHTPMYSNPMMQRPMPENMITSGLNTPTDPYTGEQRFASGGIAQDDIDATSQAHFNRLLGTRTSDEEKELQSAMLSHAKSEGFGIIPRSKTQSTSNPYSAAMTEFNALSKKYGIPVAKAPKANLPDIDSHGGAVEAAGGGIMHGLGGYSDGGRLLRGPGDGVSDSIPAQIGNRQPARLADGEFVVPARIVSELGNGSTDAGARKLYEMMDRVQKARSKTVGKDKVAVDSKASKHLPK